jgi:hypothetical protein
VNPTHDYRVQTKRTPQDPWETEGFASSREEAVTWVEALFDHPKTYAARLTRRGTVLMLLSDEPKEVA